MDYRSGHSSILLLTAGKELKVVMKFTKGRKQRRIARNRIEAEIDSLGGFLGAPIKLLFYIFMDSLLVLWLDISSFVHEGPKPLSRWSEGGGDNGCTIVIS